MKMKQTTFFAHIAVAFFILSCDNSSDTQDQKTPEKTEESKDVDTTYDLRKTEAINVFRGLYEELLTFKDNPDFHQLGFGVGSPFNLWLKNAKQHRDSPESKEFKLEVAYGDLLTLGIEYMQAKGKESDYSKFATSEFKRQNLIE
jgi:hypothetical protein